MVNVNAVAKILGFSSLVCLVDAYAAPNVSAVQGTFQTGHMLTISGSSFGIKSDAVPLVWDDFEGGTSTQSIVGNSPKAESLDGDWVWDDYTNGVGPTYSNEVTLSNSGMSSKHHFSGGGFNNSLEIDYPLRETGDAVYFSFYYYYDRLNENWSRNHKPWVVYGNTGYYPSAYIGAGNPTESDGTFRNSVQDSDIDSRTLWGNISISDLAGEWIRHEFYLRQSSPNGNDGVWRHTAHRVTQPEIIIVEDENNYTTRATLDYWTQWHFGSYHSNNSTGSVADVYLDNIYFDSTRARVEIGNASSWDNCTIREIQVANAWSDTSITINVESSRLAGLSEVYVYVVDANGDANSAGYPISVSGEGTINAPPLPPTNLNISN